MLSNKAQTVLDAWIAAAHPVVQKVYGQSDAKWPDVRKRYMQGLETIFPAVGGVNYERQMLGSVPAMACQKQASTGMGVVLYLHGGGYVHGGVEMYRGLTGRIASALHATVYVPDYRQAPDFPFPTPIEDCFTTYRALLDKGIDPGTLVLVGDSAGGAMVVTLMRKARDAGLPLPAAAVAFSPWADLTHSGVAALARDGLDPLCRLDFLRSLARHFLAGELPTHPDASPVYADLQDLSPTLIQMGENEVMLSGAMKLATRLGEARVRTTLEVWPGMFHVWHLLAGTLPEADQALHNAMGFLLQALSARREIREVTSTP